MIADNLLTSAKIKIWVSCYYNHPICVMASHNDVTFGVEGGMYKWEVTPLCMMEAKKQKLPMVYFFHLKMISGAPCDVIL